LEQELDPAPVSQVVEPAGAGGVVPGVEADIDVHRGEPDPMLDPPGTINQPAAGAARSLFWDLYDRVASSAELFAVPATAISVVVGELEAAIPVIRQSYQRHWGDACDIYVLTDRPFIPGQPDWNVVSSPSDLVSILDEGISHFPLLVLDVPRELPAFVRPLIQRLRGSGVGMVRYVLDGDPSDEDLATWFGELGRPSVLDLATPVGTDRILDLLDRGEPVVSVAGMPISTELLLAIRLDQERIV
jgi:hypothetical protein